MQGDLIEHVPIGVPQDSGEVLEAAGLIMVVSHSCEFTKTMTKPGYPILVAPAVEISAFDPGRQGQIRNDLVTRYWPLPVGGPVDLELAVDLGLVQPVLRQDLLGGDRWASAPAVGRIALADRLFSMISLRKRPDDQ
jgi:hypothetical protein